MLLGKGVYGDTGWNHLGAGGLARFVHTTAFGWHEIPIFEQVKSSPGLPRRQFTQPSVQARQSRSASGRLSLVSAFSLSFCSASTRAALAQSKRQKLLKRMGSA
jgi:hypothetical protein